MKLKLIAGILALFAIGSTQAGVTPTFILHLDGTGPHIAESMAWNMCVRGGTQVYRGGVGNKLNAIYCDGVDTSVSGLATGTKLWITMNNADDGSVGAINRVIYRSAPIEVLDQATCPAPSMGAPYIDGSIILTCTGTKLVTPDGAFSTVERNIWKALALTSNNSSTPLFTTKSGFIGQSFGIVVSDKLYAALQTEQGLVSGLYDGANQPNITRQQYTSILNSVGAYHTDWTPFFKAAAPNVGTNKNMNLCRYTNGSGTQAGMEIYFLNNPCASNNPTFGALNAVQDADSFGTFKVIENADFRDVETCLNAHNDHTVNPLVKADGSAADEFAIGIMSLNNIYNRDPLLNGLTRWHFVKLDGVSPTMDSILNGNYNYAFESIFVYRSDIDLSHKNFMNKFISGLSVYNSGGTFVVPYSATSHTDHPSSVNRGTTLGNSCQPFSLAE